MDLGVSLGNETSLVFIDSTGRVLLDAQDPLALGRLIVFDAVKTGTYLYIKILILLKFCISHN